MLLKIMATATKAFNAAIEIQQKEIFDRENGLVYVIGPREVKLIGYQGQK